LLASRRAEIATFQVVALFLPIMPNVALLLAD
jgi:hypothetical protein